MKSSAPLIFLTLVLAVFLATPIAAQSEFLGSDKCMSCHEKIYDTWKQSVHNKVIREITPTDNNVIADWKGEIKVKGDKIAEATIKLSRGGDGSYLATLVDTKDPSREVTYTVSRTHGAGWIRVQVYHTRIGERYYVLPISWDVSSAEFESTWMMIDAWYDEDGSLKQPSPDMSFDMGCAGCHYTGMEMIKEGDGYTATSTEISVGCEKCHGPGSEHVKSPEAEGNIFNPRNMDYDRGMDVCNQCHMTAYRSVPNGLFRWPWNDEENKPYRIGESREDYQQAGRPGEPSPQDTGARTPLDTYHSLSKSGHYEAGTTCSDCHDPHGGPAGSQLARSDSNNNLCLFCHSKEKEFAGPEMIMQHTRHSYSPGKLGTSRCTGCHQTLSRRQRTASAGAAGYRAPATGFLGIITPRVSLEMYKNDPENVSANSCNGCHTEWSGDEAGYEKGVAAYEAKFTKHSLKEGL